MAIYPPLRLGLINSLSQMKSDLEADPQLFNHPDCPYDQDVIDVLKRLLSVKIVEKVVIQHDHVAPSETKKRGRPTKPGKVSDEGSADVADEVQAILRQLKDLQPEDGIMDKTLQLQIIKTRTALIEKLIAMEERSYNIKKMSNFMEVVLQVLDDCVSEDGRDIFLRKIAPYRS